MLALPLKSTVPSRALGVWVAGLFAKGEQGVWYDPSDMSTMFQDAAGTIPVTAMGQPVGLILDKSKGLVLSSELVTNSGPEFINTIGWIPRSTGSVSVVAGKLRVSTGAFAWGGASISFATTLGKTYQIKARVVALIGSLSNVRLYAANNADISSAAKAGPDGTQDLTLIYTATTLTTWISLQGTIADTVFDFDIVSVKELHGNHAKQSTSASRPVYSARYNVLTATEALATQSVTTVETDYTLTFSGTGSITLSGSKTGTYTAGTHTLAGVTAGTLTLTVSGSVTKADLRVSNDGSGLPLYQRVNTASDYDTAGSPPYLFFDGVDDFLVTNSIDFTGTDKMTVFAGVRKFTASANTNTVAELGAGILSSNGSFGLFAPSGGGASSYAFASRGSAYSISLTNAYAAPITNVASGVASISEDKVILRVNGAQAASDSADQGSGNYGNYPLYIGRRGGTSLPFNGRLYGLIVRGAQTDDAHLTNTEKYLAYKTGVTL